VCKVRDTSAQSLGSERGGCGVPLGIGQVLDVSGGDVVHCANDRDPPVLDEGAKRVALLEDLRDDARHVATSHGVD
jgi:hypothetical protein